MYTVPSLFLPAFQLLHVLKQSLLPNRKYTYNSGPDRKWSEQGPDRNQGDPRASRL